jgi:spoIIIJ-associated protein
VNDDEGWVEATGDTVDDAIDAVLDLLDLDEDDTEIEVLPRNRAGRARVRARPRDEEGEDDDDLALGDVVAAEDEDDDDYEDDEVDDEEKIDIARQFCVGLLESFGLDGNVDAWVDDEAVLRVEIEGRDLGVLIGRRGRTLQSLADLVRTVVQRQTVGRTRLFVDVEGYRAKRRSALHDYAVRLAKRVVESGVEVALEPMPAGDRKVVHDAVGSIPGASTFSEGEEPQRYVVISAGPGTAGAAPARSGGGRRRR